MAGEAWVARDVRECMAGSLFQGGSRLVFPCKKSTASQIKMIAKDKLGFSFSSFPHSAFYLLTLPPVLILCHNWALIL
jgi:hypothetical protein